MKLIETARAAFRAGSSYIADNKPTERQLLSQWVRRLGSPLVKVLTHGLITAAIVAYRNFFFIVGLLWSEVKRVTGDKID